MTTVEGALAASPYSASSIWQQAFPPFEFGQLVAIEMTERSPGRKAVNPSKLAHFPYFRSCTLQLYLCWTSGYIYQPVGRSTFGIHSLCDLQHIHPNSITKGYHAAG